MNSQHWCSRCFCSKRELSSVSFFIKIFAMAAIFVCVVVPSASAQKLGRIECRAVRSALLHRAVRYCAILPPDYDSDKSRRYPVLYFLHGLGGNEQMLVSSGGWNIVEDLWQARKIGKFLIVTPDADTTFYINSENGRVPYESFFVREFIPFIDRAYRTISDRSGRGIGGISMGGYGALHLAFDHPKLFVSVSANSAALLAKIPNIHFASPQEALLLRALRPFGAHFDRAFWNRNDPLHLARAADLSGLKIYLDCGLQDDYGFERGAEALNRILDGRKIPHEFHLYPGRHDWEYFAAHLPAVLEFHSRAFGLLVAKPR